MLIYFRHQSLKKSKVLLSVPTCPYYFVYNQIPRTYIVPTNVAYFLVNNDYVFKNRKKNNHPRPNYIVSKNTHCLLNNTN